MGEFYKRGDRALVRSFEEMQEAFGIDDDGQLQHENIRLTKEEYERHIGSIDKNGDGKVLITGVYRDETPDNDGYEMMYKVDGFKLLHPDMTK